MRALQLRFRTEGTGVMIEWALMFFVIALLAAALGFGNVAGLSARFGRIFVAVAVVILVLTMLAGRGPIWLR